MSIGSAWGGIARGGIARGAVVAVALASGVAAAAEGQQVYQKACVACHAAGVAGAPKLGDKTAWGPRLAAGPAGLTASVIKGKGAMPPKAGNAALTEAEIKAAVEFMVATVK